MQFIIYKWTHKSETYKVMVDLYQDISRGEWVTNWMFQMTHPSFNEVETKGWFLFPHPLFPASSSNLYKREAWSLAAVYHDSALNTFCWEWKCPRNPVFCTVNWWDRLSSAFQSVPSYFIIKNEKVNEISERMCLWKWQ